jgi:ribosome maturation factor RimP
MSTTDRPRDVRSRAVEILEPVIAGEGYELVDAEYVMARGRPILRLFIDTVPPGTPDRGVTVEDCSHVSRLVSDLLDVEDVVPGEYTLEVSSPGLFRPLTKPEHFERATGERVKVKTYEKIEGRKTFTGRLEKRDDETVEVTIDDGTCFRIPTLVIAKANLEPQLD